MVKKIVFLTALFMLLKPAIPFLEYVVNYDYIVKELCENKEKPQLQCNGKCHLKKELAKSAADEQSPADKKQNSKQEIEVLFYQETPIFFQKMPVVFTDKKVNASYQNFYALTAIQSTFHPPIC
jgi:hypothetical protein